LSGVAGGGVGGFTILDFRFWILELGFGSWELGVGICYLRLCLLWGCQEGQGNGCSRRVRDRAGAP
jgi:hypothetical protein